jgi:hypothetical protein
MAIVSVAITVSFHLNHQPSDLEVRISRPLGSIFWVLSVVTLGMGVANYISEFDPAVAPGFLLARLIPHCCLRSLLVLGSCCARHVEV